MPVGYKLCLSPSKKAQFVTALGINDYPDLRVDKLLAYFGRAEPRDAVDLYFILQKAP
ncbi:MAG: hypothetical protein Q8L87_16500 [Anaerolineales bacterium]|nr:hypothetical protein [Anaerolineales bacterium]